MANFQNEIKGKTEKSQEKLLKTVIKKKKKLT